MYYIIPASQRLVDEEIRKTFNPGSPAEVESEIWQILILMFWF